VTPRVTRSRPEDDTLILPGAGIGRMRCEFCARALPENEPDNLALLRHVREAPACGQQFRFLLENLRTSWTPAMSGG
jgi:hypothetical protein